MGARETIDLLPNNSMEEHNLDKAIALSLQEHFNRGEVEVIAPERKNSPTIGSIVDESWELADPNPNIHQLYTNYDAQFFGRKLVDNGVTVDWSKRMTLCAGVCSFEVRGRFCSIRLSEPLLKLRPRRDLIQTLLHEMIHAYLFVTNNNKDRDGHGVEFLSHMHRINEAVGTRITVYHSFNQEVMVYRQHWWKCSGPCQHRPPYFGIVKRAMNRAPSQRDFWWNEHQKTCGGTYTKIKEPEDYGKKKSGKRRQVSKVTGNKDLRKMLDKKDSTKTKSSGQSSSESSEEKPPPLVESAASFTPFAGSGHVLQGKTRAIETDKDDRRTKLLRAAEKRMVSTSVDSLSLGTKRKVSEIDSDSTSKRSKLKRERGFKGHNVPYNTTKVHDKAPLEVSNSSSSHSGSSPHSPDLVVLEDDDYGEDFKMCPVCGLSNIPSAIINTHVSLCLEMEDEAECM